MQEEGLNVGVPAKAPTPHASVVVLQFDTPLKIEEPGVTQNADGSITLTASDARIHGEQLRFESGEHRDSLGFWTNPSDWPEWEVAVAKPGRFDVSADLASLGNSSFVFAAGTKTVKVDTVATGDYGKFQSVHLGTVEIARPGKITFAVKPLREGWQPINLRVVRLKPSER
jgi:hypothetical protein